MSSTLLSIIMPTKDRAQLLLATLSEVIRQVKTENLDAEIVVVQDDSSDPTSKVLRELSRQPVCIVKAEGKGPATARNLGLNHARGDIVLFFDDDVLPWENAIKGHVEFHRQHRSIYNGVLGFITWHPRFPLTPFMYWLEHGGPQFCFHEIPQTGVLPYHFYTGNISLKRQAVLRAGGFDEHFKEAAFEDIELGFRMFKSGLELAYQPNLGAFHLSSVSNPQDYYHQRVQKLGRWLPLFHARVSEAKEYFERHIFSEEIVRELSLRPIEKTTSALLGSKECLVVRDWPPLPKKATDVYQHLYKLHLVKAFLDSQTDYQHIGKSSK